MDLTDFKNEITSVPLNEPVFIYVGVGAAAGMINEDGRLPLEHYHQFPPFLQDLRNQIQNLHLFLLLIDKQQENPPYVALDYGCTGLVNHHKNTEKKIQVFTYREYVYTNTDVHHLDQAINITEMLRDLNYFALEKNATLLYHDFSGRAVAKIAEYFENDPAFVGHLDQLVYGLSAREDHGCLFDLTQQNAFFPFFIEGGNNNHTRPVVKLFNYYHYIANNALRRVEAEKNNYTTRMQPLVKIQRDQIINNIRTRFKDVNLGVLRQIRKKNKEVMAQQHEEQEQAQQQSQANDIDIKYIFNDLPRAYRDMFFDLYKNKEYQLIDELCFHYCANELHVLAQLTEMDISGQEMLDLITADEDPFKWYNNIKNFM